MNDIAKQSTSDRFLAALKKEHLSKREAGESVGLTPAQVSYLFNKNYWKRLSDESWNNVLAWVNSGYSLHEYPKHKRGSIISQAIKPAIDTIKAKIKPIEVKEENIDKAEAPDFKDDIEEIKRSYIGLSDAVIEVEQRITDLMNTMPTSHNSIQKTIVDIEIRVNGKPIRLE